ncbi:fibronectin type III domain-containing protein [Pelotalea chapellei]|uniref:Fibronectin type III domain-containing protein n=1 Tax=Pelotalea chapellei TaxID=44671 RepID=A0ABS5U3R0_9BACT|nr:fibronectin type III domain-containing protein [Pelotalea chapellei]MBT1070306.1 fibronectin type III domain-containing protein [Pelotalea chapellei]
MKKLPFVSATFSILIAGCSGINKIPFDEHLYASTGSSTMPTAASAALISSVSPATSIEKENKQAEKHAAKGQITLEWNSVPGAKWYNLYYGTKPGVTKKSPKKIKRITTTFHTVTGLSINTTYFFVVTAANSTTESPESIEISGKSRKH